MNQKKTPPLAPTDDGGSRIRWSGNVVVFRRIAMSTAARAVRLPIASLVGVGSALVAHTAIVMWIPPEASLLAASVVHVFAGIALFLFLSTFMVLREGRLEHVGSLFRTGAAISLCVAAVTAVPMIIGITLLPPDWLFLPQWRFLREWWPIASVGLGVVATVTVLPGFLVTWPIHASTGLPLSKSVLFVWRHLERESYSRARMSLFVALTGWLLLTLPGFGLLVPVLYAHLATVLSDELVVADEP
ncbi:MAG: hypothetical protein WBM57_11485 [Woeseiaceae bacterium]